MTKKHLVQIANYAALLILGAVVVLESVHLITCHSHSSSEWKEYQQCLLAGIRESARIAKSSQSEEDLIKSFNAECIGHMTKDDVRLLPRHQQGQHEGFVDGVSGPLDWDVYEIDPICNYKGVMRIGLDNGRFVDVDIKYTYCEGECSCD